MEEALELARSKGANDRMAGVERLLELLEASRRSLSASETTSLVDCCLDLLRDVNFRVSQGALQALASAAVLSAEHLQLHLSALVPAVVERLGDSKQPVRDASRRLLLTLMEVSSPTIIVERAGSYAWVHKGSKVREEFARTVTSAIGLFASTELPLQRAILPPILQMLKDSNHGVREAAILCIEEMYKQAGSQFNDELRRYHLPGSMVKEINARLERIEPQVHSPGVKGSFPDVDMKLITLSPKRSSPRARSFRKERSLFGSGGDITEKQIEPISVYSEKELIWEIEKIISNLVPEKDWSVRIAAMQRVEGLVLGGATDYTCFRGLLKQLTGPLSTQLSDRRSSIVKQACHLLCFLSKELLGDFESFAEMFIPVLLKLVVVTVLVIAESADNCIKTILHNCNVARVLPHIVDRAKTDRSAVLRARCCEYALLILEQWHDSPEIQRYGDQYEDLIRCCVADAMSEVRSTARMCYRLFSKTWPERSQRLFSSFDSNIQRIINEEDRGFHRQYSSSSSICDRTSQMSFIHASPQTSSPGYGTSAKVAIDRSTSLPYGTSLSSGLHPSQAKSLGKGAEGTLERVLHASKQKVTAIEKMLRGLKVSDKQNCLALRSSSLDLGVDLPSSRDPPFPPAVPASIDHPTSLDVDSTINRRGHHNGGLSMSDIISQIQISKESAQLSNYHNAASPTKSVSSSFSAFSTKRGSGRLLGRGSTSVKGNNGVREAQRFMSLSDQQYLDKFRQEGNFSYLQSNYVPNSQGPLLGKPVAGHLSTSRRSYHGRSLSSGEVLSRVDCPVSVSDKLSEGLNPSSDWSARVSAFNYLQSLLQQGSKGVQEVVQYFDKVMKLLFQHLDDPHHKVAQAALSTLAEIITSCKKPYESYMDRMLPHVFCRLIDPKELVRQTCSRTLRILSETYTIDSLLPALLRSLDEQRSPKAKLAVIEFAIASFNKYEAIFEGSHNSGILKMWLAKLAPLANDKNTKLKEAAISCIISVYSHYDSITVLNFIISLSIEEQSFLRRALKQHTPRIEVDLINYLQSKKERQRLRASYDSSDADMSSEGGYIDPPAKRQPYGWYSACSAESDSGKKWGSGRVSSISTGGVGAASDATQHNLNQDAIKPGSRDVISTASQNLTLQSGWTEDMDDMKFEALSLLSLENNGVIGTVLGASGRFGDDEALVDANLSPEQTVDSKKNVSSDGGPEVPQILQLIVDGDDEPASLIKRTGLQQLIEISEVNDVSIWLKHFNQVLTTVLGVLDDADPSIRELALSLILEMIKNLGVGLVVWRSSNIHLIPGSIPVEANSGSTYGAFIRPGHHCGFPSPGDKLGEA
ncbi:CLIP-associated protein-like isoform X2 [Punica granatum]|uniref:CLIP-associated protein-like isoform X2 n=1 Tax=Punica granatum TaxID=22663 RepID=A0A6P8E6I7_PUNGR|nr:CLIP-associated protein-like isoform X2 [Punica granatum]